MQNIFKHKKLSLTYSVPFCLRIRNCSGESIACHSSSDFWNEPGAAAMARTPPRKLRLVRVVMGFGAKGLQWGLKREVGAGFDKEANFERIVMVVEEERGGVLRI